MAKRNTRNGHSKATSTPKLGVSNPMKHMLPGSRPTSELGQVQQGVQSQSKQIAMSIAQLNLPAGVINPLEANGILLVGDLLHKTEAQLRDITNIGDKAIRQIFGALEDIGFYRAGSAKRIEE